MFDDLLTALRRVSPDLSDAQRVELLDALEGVKATCAAVQARVTVDFAESQEHVAEAWRARAEECAAEGDFEAWVAARDQARRATIQAPAPAEGNATDGRRSRRRPGAELGVAGQVALARRESPSRGSRHLTAALALVHHLPHTLDALEAGAISEWRAEIVTREAGILTPEQQTEVDAELFETLGVDAVGRLGDRELARRVRAIAYRIDPESVVARARGAESERRVSLRPAPDTMCHLTAYLPVAQGVAVHAALVAAAAAARAGGDERGKGQVMADTVVERVTGQAHAAAVPVEVHVVITDRALFTGAFGGGPASETPAQVPGYGSVPAAWVRYLLQPSAVPDATTAKVWLRRLYTHPEDGTLVAMESTRRTFTGGLRRFLIARDGTCTTPWCDAPIAHLDHTVRHADGGRTTAQNGRGTCVRCNHTKELPGWVARTAPDPPAGGGHTVVITTPTGWSYRSAAPPLLPGAPPGTDDSLHEHHWETVLAVA